MTASMNVVCCVEPGQLTHEERLRPLLKREQVLDRVRAVGVCGTDMHIFKGTQPYLTYPRVMGHEIAGEVAEAPPGSDLRPGDRVCVMPYLACGACVACRKGRPNCCVRIEVLGVHRDGALAEYVAVPAAYVLKADGVAMHEAAMVEFLSIGAHAVGPAAPKAGARVLVVGAGPIGLAAALFAKLAGAEVTALDTRPERLAFCGSQLKADHVIEVGDDTYVQLRDLTNGDFFDVVFDATGNAAAITKRFSDVAHAGAYGLISVVPQDITFSDPEFHKREMNFARLPQRDDGRLPVRVERHSPGVGPDNWLSTLTVQGLQTCRTCFQHGSIPPQA